MATFDVPEVPYPRYTDRQLAAVPLAFLAVSLAVLAATFLLVGSPLALGIEFTGGTELVLETTASEGEIVDAFEIQPESVQAVAANENQYIVQFAAQGDDRTVAEQSEVLAEQAETLDPVSGNDGVVQSRSTTSASFGAQTQQTAIFGIAAAFVGMSLITFALFRTFVPSIAIVLSAFSDLVIPLAFMSLTDIPLTLGTVAALLMIIGYSVDSDILLNNHILRRGGSFYESANRAISTGVTMTITSMAAMLVMAAAAWAFGIDLMTQIGLILFVGLAADLMNTYLLNMSLLRWYKFHGVNR